MAINLLPWRDELEKRRKIRFYQECCVGLLMVLFFLCTSYFFINTELSQEENKTKLLRLNLDMENKQVIAINQLNRERDFVFSQLKFLQGLRNRQVLMLKSLAQIEKVVPTGVRLIKLVKKNQLLLLSGEAFSNREISHLVDNINQVNFLKNAHLVEVKGLGENISFKVESEIMLPKNE